MRADSRATRGFLAATLSCAAATGIAALFFGLVGNGIPLDAEARAAFVAVGAGLAVGLALVTLLLHVGVRWFWWPLVFVAWWLSVETFVSPHLEGPLKLRAYYFVLDVDHIPMDGNSDNIRSSREAAEFTPDGLNLVFLGDSFTFGYDLEPEETFVHRVETLLAGAYPELPVRTANFGWTSSSPLLLHRRLLSIGEKYAPDVVVLCVDMTDFRDDILYSNMLEQRGIYGFYARIPLALQALNQFAPKLFQRWSRSTNDNLPKKHFFATEQPLEQSRPYFEEIRGNIDAIAAWCAERDVHFVVFVLPRHYQYSDREAPLSWEKGRYEILGPHSHEPFRWFAELELERPYPIHSLLETFQETDVFPTCFERDPHWNAAGARVAGDAMARILKGEIDRHIADPRR